MQNSKEQSALRKQYVTENLIYLMSLSEIQIRKYGMEWNCD
jgi:hypothetical protein